VIFTTNTMLGVFCLMYSVVAAIVYLVRPRTFTKLERFQTLYGKVPGSVLHVVFYCIAPLILGLALLIYRK